MPRAHHYVTLEIDGFFDLPDNKIPIIDQTVTRKQSISKLVYLKYTNWIKSIQDPPARNNQVAAK